MGCPPLPTGSKVARWHRVQWGIVLALTLWRLPHAESKQGTKAALWGSTGTPPACLPRTWQVQGGPAPPGQHCSSNLAGTHSSRVPGQTHLFHFYFWPPEKWSGRCPAWGMVNGPIPGGLRVPGCGRAWQAPCHSSGPSSFGKLCWGSEGRRERALVPHNPRPCTQAQWLLEPNDMLQTGEGGRVPAAPVTSGSRAPLMPWGVCW